MKRFTIWQNGSILGTFPGANESEALDAASKDQGYLGFEDACAKLGLSRDNYKVAVAEVK